MDKLATCVDCACVGQCVGFECARSRSAALVAAGRAEDAKRLLEGLLLAEAEDEALRSELRAVYEVIVSGNRRSTMAASADTQLKAPDGEPGTAGVSASPRKRKRGHPGSAQELSGTPLGTVLATLGEDFDCVICSKLLFEPITTPCGHTYCRNCLSRAIDFTDTCPMCRSVLHLEDPSTLPVTNVLRTAIQHCFPEEYESRRKEVEADAPSAENAMSRLPLFPLNAVVFPRQRFPMHIFEARYRLMLRRIMQGSKKFGLIALKRTRNGSSELCTVGCVLEVTKADRIPDGRSLIETVARERFRVHGRMEVDGYLVGRTEVLHDTEDIDGEEVREVEERARTIVSMLMDHGARLQNMQHALQRAGAVPTVAQGPDALGMWLAGMLVSDLNERQRLLEMTNAKTRLVEMTDILERFRNRIMATAANNEDGATSRECCIQ